MKDNKDLSDRCSHRSVKTVDPQRMNTSPTSQSGIHFTLNKTLPNSASDSPKDISQDARPN
jgi:hypothetical protein